MILPIPPLLAFTSNIYFWNAYIRYRIGQFQRFVEQTKKR
jgi:hypothetical protein